MTTAAPAKASQGRPARRDLLPRALDALERAGNRLPDPVTMFVILAGVVLMASWIAARFGLTVAHPKDGTPITAVNLLDREGLRRVLTEAVRNFTGFAPLGTVLVAMIGVGVAEGSGLIAAAMRALVTGMPRTLLTTAVVFTGVQANLAADAGLIVLPPIAALLFAAAGRHPHAGIAAAFAGVSGGFSANLLPSTLDVLLIGFTQEAVDSSRLLPGYRAQVLGNWYFLAASTPVLTALGTWVTHRFVEPRLGPWRGTAEAVPAADPSEGRGLRAALIATVATIGLFTWLAAGPGSPLLGEGATTLDRMRPFFDSMVLLVMVFFLVPGLVYGIASRRIRSDRDAARLAAEAMSSMGAYIVLAFAAAQFVSWFAWSNLAAILAISGARGLQAIGLNGAPLLAAFVVFSAVLDLVTASASAKWAVLAPVFVPMFALLGFTPEGTQAVYRVGDSCTNMITPLLPYMPFMLAYMRRYDAKAGVGTLIAMMLPYFVVFMIGWTALLLLFYGLNWPIGPGVGLQLPG